MDGHWQILSILKLTPCTTCSFLPILNELMCESFESSSLALENVKHSLKDSALEMMHAGYTYLFLLCHVTEHFL